MHPTDKAARIAGAIYISLTLTAPFSLIYVPNRLIVHGDATATATNVLAHQMLFRLGIVGDLIGTVTFMFLVMALYRLFSGVNKSVASVMVILAMVSSAVSFGDALNNIAALILFRGGEFLTIFNQAQLNALAMLFLRLHGQGNVIAELFWGLWLFPFGMLVIRSRFLPRILGWWLIVNGVAYMAMCIVELLVPQYSATLSRLTFPVLFGEMAIALWLLIKGAKLQSQPMAALSVAG